jgi:superfamily I DNA and/or RNA helicase
LQDLQGRDIGVIAPYAAQITLLLRYLNSEPQYLERFKSVLGIQRAMQLSQIEVKTVDGFEGREKEVIIFSTVRNNQNGHIGFLADKKRLNVGLTRAKRGLIVLGSISTLKAGKPEYDEGVSKEFTLKKRRGHESWQRYAQFMLDKKHVVSLQGSRLTEVLYGHWEAVQQENWDEAFAEIEISNDLKRILPIVLRG